jgi:hypothetical protein
LAGRSPIAEQLNEDKEAAEPPAATDACVSHAGCCAPVAPSLARLIGAFGIKDMKRIYIFILLAFVLSVSLHAQVASQAVGPLDSRIAALERNVAQLPSEGLVVFLFGAFCALWAVNSGRSGWLWFFLGLFFSVITVLVLLYKNGNDRHQASESRKKPFDLQDFRQQ